MKILFIIFVFTSIGYIFCLISLKDISLSTEFIVNIKEYPNNILPVDSIFYFKVEVEDLTDKLIELRTEEKDSFIVKIALFEGKQEIKNELEWE